MNDLRAIWKRRYPNSDGCPIFFVSNAKEVEILEAVDDVIAEWGKDHPGEPYPLSVTVASEH
jgi:hypothetical protein